MSMLRRLYFKTVFFQTFVDEINLLFILLRKTNMKCIWILNIPPFHQSQNKSSVIKHSGKCIPSASYTFHTKILF